MQSSIHHCNIVEHVCCQDKGFVLSAQFHWCTYEAKSQLIAMDRFWSYEWTSVRKLCIFSMLALQTLGTICDIHIRDISGLFISSQFYRDTKVLVINLENCGVSVLTEDEWESFIKVKLSSPKGDENWSMNIWKSDWSLCWFDLELKTRLPKWKSIPLLIKTSSHIFFQFGL